MISSFLLMVILQLACTYMYCMCEAAAPFPLKLILRMQENEFGVKKVSLNIIVDITSFSSTFENILSTSRNCTCI